MQSAFVRFLNLFPQEMKHRTISYLFDRYLGHFFQKKLTQDQLSVNITDGEGRISSLELDVDSLNRELSFLPFRFVDDCVIDEIVCFIPWSSLLTRSCKLEIFGATLIANVCSLDRTEPIDQSDYLTNSFMSSSMEFAKEICGDVEEIYSAQEQEDKVEGLEIFARLIDSVLRRVEVTARDTRLIVRAPESDDDVRYGLGNTTTVSSKVPEIHFCIKYFKCEKCGDENYSDVTLAPRSFCKKLTFENVDVIIEGKVVCKVTGSHSVELNVKDGKCDLKLSFASFLLGLLDVNQINQIIDIFTSIGPSKQRHTSGDKPMSSADYAKIEEQLQRDVESVLRRNACVSVSGGNTWTTLVSESNNEVKFLPLKRDDDKEENTLGNFTCSISLPGMVVCLRNLNEPCDVISCDILAKAAELPTLQEVKKFLTKNLHFQNLRLIALPIKMQLKEGCNFSLLAGDLSLVETSPIRIETLLETEAQMDGLGLNTPNFQLELIGKKMSLACKAVTRLTFDLTLWERLDYYYKARKSVTSDASSLPSSWALTFQCPSLICSLLFPVPDLRDVPDTAYSLTRSEYLVLELRNISLKTNFLKLETTFDDILAKFICSSGHYDVARATGGSEKIKLVLKNGPSAYVPFDNLLDTEEESLFTEQIGPFQTKRNFIKSSEDNNEPIVTPNDLEGSIKYFELCQSLTRFQLEVCGSSCSVFIQNKWVMDQLFNRFGNDYVLWKPIHPKLVDINPKPTTKHQAYFACQSGLADSIDSEASFHSLSGNVNRLANTATFMIRVDNLDVSMLHHKHIITVQNVFLGCAIGLNDYSTNLVSLHCCNVCWKYMDKVTIDENSLTDTCNSLNMTFEIVNSVSKKIKFAIQLVDALLLHVDIDAFTSFWDIIDVANEEILGYDKKLQRETELHINIVNSGIEYNRPGCRNSLITFEGCYITSMVVENTNETVLRIIIEESCLHFVKNAYAVGSCRSYVTVIDSGIIDLNLKFTSDEDSTTKLNFSASNNVINIKVCNDSLDALLKLMIEGEAGSSGANAMDPELPSYGEACAQEHICSSLIKDAINDIEEKGISPLPSSQTNDSSPDDDDFWILDDIGAGIRLTAEPQIRVLTKEPIQIYDNHFPIVKVKNLPESLGIITEHYLLREMTLMVYLYGGRDFEDIVPENHEVKDEKLSDIKSDRADNSMDIWENIDLKSSAEKTFSSSRHASIASLNCQRTFGGKYRQNDVCVQLSLSKIRSTFDKFEKNSPISWRFLFTVQDIAIIDRVLRSKIKKMLYSLEAMNKGTSTANMFSLKAVTMRNSIDQQEECDLKISMKPLRINIDQDTILFLMEYFNQLGSPNSAATNASNGPERFSNEQGPFYNIHDQTDMAAYSLSNNVSDANPGPKSALYVKSFLFSPDVPIRLDYHGKRLDFEQGALSGLLMGLAQLNQSEIRLKRLHNKHGILGLNRVFLYAMQEWYSDIKKHQLLSIIGSIGPLNSIRQLLQGIFDLIWIPLDQYRRDRRLVKGIQRGASSFSSSTAIAIIDLANRLVHLIQGTAQFAHDVVSPDSRNQINPNRGALPSNQPRDLREGVAAAYVVMREGLNETYRNVASAGIQADGMGEAFGGLIRQIPSNMIRPIINASEATSNVLVGMRNQLTPEARKDDQEKWKR